MPGHERIKHIPPVKHDDLFEASKDADAFILPFELCELVFSVDPVKLYEYINFGKNILCVNYPEIQRFEPFVFFYTDYDSFKKSIAIMIHSDGRKYSDDARIDFLSHNTWEQRGSEITFLLK